MNIIVVIEAKRMSSRRAADKKKPTADETSDNTGMDEQVVKALRELTASNKELKTSNEGVLERLKGLEDAVKSSGDKVGAHIEKVDAYIVSNDEEVENLKRRINTLETTVKNVVKVNKQQHVNLQRLAFRHDKTITKLRTIEEGRKRKNVIIEGAPEVNGEFPKKIITDILTDIGSITPGERIGIDSAYRMGKKDPKARRPRNILIRFRDMDTKIRLFQKIAKMSTIPKWKNVYIADDLTASQQDERKDLRCLAALARQQGETAKVKGNKLHIGEEAFTHRDIDDLPEGIDLESAKVVRVDGGTAFQSHHAYLSNMYNCCIEYEDITWHSSEQLFWYLLAEYNQDDETAAKIKLSDDAYEAKKYSHEISYTKADSDTVKYDLMVKAVKLKFTQDDYLRDQLVQTKGKLFEATKTKGWGCGYTLAQIDQISATSVKSNKMGDILEELRAKLIAEDQED